MVSINLAVGPSCFVRCRGCYNHFANTALTGRSVSVSELLAFMTAAKEVGATQATISGGDPLTHPQILDLLSGVAELKVRIKVDTVGTALLGEAPIKFYGKGNARLVDVNDLAKYVHTLGLPIDSPNDEASGKFRVGRPHLIDEVLSAIRLALGARMRVCINTVAHRENADQLDAILDVVGCSGAHEWQIFEFQPIGPLGSKAASTLVLNEGEFCIATESMLRQVRYPQLKVATKDRKVRHGIYFMVDDAGLAWIPGTSGNERETIGHITQDRRRVLQALEDRVQKHRRQAGEGGDQLPGEAA